MAVMTLQPAKCDSREGQQATSCSTGAIDVWKPSLGFALGIPSLPLRQSNLAWGQTPNTGFYSIHLMDSGARYLHVNLEERCCLQTIGTTL